MSERLNPILGLYMALKPRIVHKPTTYNLLLCLFKDKSKKPYAETPFYAPSKGPRKFRAALARETAYTVSKNDAGAQYFVS